MNKKWKKTNSDIIKKGDYIETIITVFNKKLQIPAEFLGWDTMIHNSSVRFFNLDQNIALIKGEAWLFEVTEVNITGKYINLYKDREIIIFTVKPITRIIDRESTYFDSKSNQWVEIFSCGRISAYKEKRTPAMLKTRIFQSKGKLRKLEVVTNKKTGEIIKILNLAEYTLGQFLEESRKKLGKKISKISLKNIPEIPIELLGKIKHFPFTRQI
ncbi:hypothetical protein KAJ61_01015 [Candidatus Parcubacteria bacterium]|nr:hypothetical protein [Candidatus Parcubacteria bacterium]